MPHIFDNNLCNSHKWYLIKHNMYDAINIATKKFVTCLFFMSNVKLIFISLTKISLTGSNIGVDFINIYVIININSEIVIHTNLKG